MKPYCFVLMPFGRKTDESGHVVEFDSVYDKIIDPAVRGADLEPIRADEEIVGGIIHKPMFERLMLCDYAVADLTTANANVFYELGVRHGIRPYSTVPIAASGTRLPFDVRPIRAILYDLDDIGLPKDAESARDLLKERLKECRNPTDDSPLYQLVTDLPRPDIQRLKTDTFRDVVEYSQTMKRRLERARQEGTNAVDEIKNELNILDADPAVVIDLLLSYRAVEAWASMVKLVDQMGPPLQQTILVQEQLGFALNRLGERTRATRVIAEVIRSHGPSSETNGILGRIYKDQWKRRVEANDPAAAGYLTKAIDTYLQGFQADWRDAYPGINAVTLMEFTDPPDERQADLIPVVSYAVQRRIASKTPDYWDYASAMELAVLGDRRDEARHYLGLALASDPEVWQPKTTADTVRMFRQARDRQARASNWIKEIEDALLAAEG